MRRGGGVQIVLDHHLPPLDLDPLSGSPSAKPASRPSAPQKRGPACGRIGVVSQKSA